MEQARHFQPVLLSAIFNQSLVSPEFWELKVSQPLAILYEPSCYIPTPILPASGFSTSQVN
jgi:hypothetical protein